MRWRYVVLGLGFLGLAVVRAVHGAPVWAVVFVVAAVVNAWLAVHEAPRAEPVNVDRVDRSEVDEALDGYRTSARQWQVLGVGGVLVGAVLLLLEPPLAVFAGVAALFALHRAHRASRTVATLRRLPVVGR